MTGNLSLEELSRACQGGSVEVFYRSDVAPATPENAIPLVFIERWPRSDIRILLRNGMWLGVLDVVGGKARSWGDVPQASALYHAWEASHNFSNPCDRLDSCLNRLDALASADFSVESYTFTFCVAEAA